jgi:flotillin
MLPDLLGQIVETVKGVAIDKVTVIDSGNGSQGIPDFMSQLPAAVIKLTEQVETATGINILSGLGANQKEADATVGTGEEGPGS